MSGVESSRLTFEQVVADSQLVVPLRFLHELAKVEAAEMRCTTQVSVLELALKFEENELFVLHATLHSDRYGLH